MLHTFCITFLLFLSVVKFSFAAYYTKADVEQNHAIVSTYKTDSFISCIHRCKRKNVDSIFYTCECVKKSGRNQLAEESSVSRLYKRTRMVSYLSFCALSIW